MRITDSISISPIAFGAMSQADFLEKFKDKRPVDVLKAKHSECKKALADSKKPLKEKV